MIYQQSSNNFIRLNCSAENFIRLNGLKKLENHPYVMYYDASSYYINDKNEIYRISIISNSIQPGPHALRKKLKVKKI